MIGERYLTRKNAVLDVAKRYLCNCGGDNAGVDPAFLSQRVKALEAGRYVLAVVGEVKAGKSTLINALLEEQILPTSVLQSSSVIVEIFKSKERFLEVHYADGSSEEIRDDPSTLETDEALDYLRKMGAIQDRFRQIPTTLIDSFIVQGRIVPGTAIPITELADESGMYLHDQESDVAEYVNSRTLENIPVKIRFGLPLKYNFDDLIIVDSPGVNAVGGVQSRTYDYLQNINAILFVKSIEEPIETESFRDFINHVVSDRTRESLFLVLSKSGILNDSVVERKLAEAQSLYRKELNSSRVIAIDAMLQIVSNDILAFESAIDLKRHYGEAKKYYADLYGSHCAQEYLDEEANYSIKRNLLNQTLDYLEDTGKDADHRDTVAKELRKRSNLDNLEDVLDKLSARAPELQLSELLQAVQKGYDEQLKTRRQTFDLLGKKKRHPQTFEKEIGSIQERLAEYKKEINEFTQGFVSRHTGLNALSRKEMNLIKGPFLEQLKEAQSDAHLSKLVSDFKDASDDIVNKIAEDMRTECQSKLEFLGSTAKAKYNITLPQVDMASITAKAKQNAYNTVKVKVDDSTGRRAAGGSAGGVAAGGTLGLIIGGPLGALIGAGIGALVGGGTGAALGEESYKDKEQFNPEKYGQIKRNSISSSVQEICENKVPTVVSNLANNLSSTFRKEVVKLIEDRHAALQEMKARKHRNEEIIAQIACEEKKMKEIESERVRIAEMLEDLR